MAKIKYSALVSDMRNKLNGSVLSANRYGSYIRNKVTPVNPQSIHQQNARQILSNLSSGFRDLDRAEIAAWNNSGVDFPFTDIFGDVKHLSGQTLYVKLNANLLKVGKPKITTPPMPEGFPPLEIASVVAGVKLNGDTSVSFAIGDDTVPEGMSLVVYSTDSLSKSISFVKNRFRFLGSFVAQTKDVDISDAFVARFGGAVVGNLVHLRVAYVNNATGQQSVPFFVSQEVVVDIA